MKKVFITLLIIISAQLLNAQFRTGAYNIIPVDTMTKFFGRLFSRLIINTDGTFNYEYRTSMSCALWYDSKGMWAFNRDTLMLMDSLTSYHWNVTFNGFKPNDSNRIKVMVKSIPGVAIPNVKVSCIFKLKDTLVAFSDASGRVLFNTENISPAKEGWGTTAADFVELIVDYVNIKSNLVTGGNTFCREPMDVNCVINEDAKDVLMQRKTYYKIRGEKLVFDSQSYSDPDPNPGRYLYGDFVFRNN